MRKIKLSLMLLLMFPFSALCADVSIPKLELITRLYPESGQLEMQTKGTFEMEVNGGYKFGGRLKLGVDDAVVDLSSGFSSLPVLTFRAAEVSINDLFDIPLSISYFTGIIDDFCTGNIFHTYFGTGIIEPKLSGFLYFGNNINYKGLHSVAGTGLSISSTFGSEWNYTRAYIYRDAYLGKGFYSGDLRSVFNLGSLKMEGFVGISFPAHSFGIYRGGLLLYYKASEYGSLLAQIGIPQFIPGTDKFDIELFYFLFEPRLSFGLFGINMSFFWHPSYYNYAPTNEEGSIDLLLDLTFGNMEEFPLTGGLASQLTYDTKASTDQFITKISPYASIAAAGVLWDLKLNVKVLPFNLDTMFEGYIGVRAEF